MYLRKRDREFIASRFDKIENMVAEMKILDKRYVKTTDERILSLYNEKYSYLRIYLEDIEKIIGGGDIK